jgi:predicted nucleotidyltransferase component of viral defense system
MLTQGELKQYAHLRRLRLADQMWKDYLQDLVLYLLYQKMPGMVFRGGTCIWKVMKGDRFSEDIDACAASLPPDLEQYLKKGVELRGFGCSILKKRRTANVLFLGFGIRSPAHPREITISVEIVVARKCADAPAPTTLYSPYPDIPPFEVVTPPAEEILIDKISAIMGRDKPRDVHDLYLLLKQGTPINRRLLGKKVPGFDSKALEKKILGMQKDWKSLGPLIVTKLPPLKEEAAYILPFFIRHAPQE